MKSNNDRWKAALIGAGEESLHTITKARELGVEVAAYDANPQALGMRIADQAFVTDISDEDATIQMLRQNPPDFVLTAPIGRYLTTAGAVNDAFLLRGVGKKAAQLCTDKFVYHKLLSENGLRNVKCLLLSGAIELGEIEMKYPAILKPRFGSGSRGIYYLANEEALKKYIGLICEGREEGLFLEEDYVLEEAAQGEEYGMDAAVEGTHFQMILLRRKIMTPLPERQATGYLSVLPEQETKLTQMAEDYMRKAVQQLGLRDCLLHGDFILRETESGEKEMFAIEMSARPSGHNLHNLFTPLATGVDMAEQYVRMQCDKTCSFRPMVTKKMLIKYFDFEDVVIKDVPQNVERFLPPDIKLVRWDCRIRPQDVMGKIPDGHSLMGRGFFILQGADDSSLINAAKAVLDRFRF